MIDATALVVASEQGMSVEVGASCPLLASTHAEASPGIPPLPYWIPSRRPSPFRIRRAHCDQSSEFDQCAKAGGLLQPRRKEAFDLFAPARPLKACAHRLAFDHDEGRQHADAEPLKEIGALLLFDAVQLERAVVAAVLKHLRKERLSAPTCTFGLGVEKHEPRLLRRNDRVSHLTRPYRSTPPADSFPSSSPHRPQHMQRAERAETSVPCKKVSADLEFWHLTSPPVFAEQFRTTRISGMTEAGGGGGARDVGRLVRAERRAHASRVAARTPRTLLQAGPSYGSGSSWSSGAVAGAARRGAAGGGPVIRVGSTCVGVEVPAPARVRPSRAPAASCSRG
jgi:hypothetical protein